MSSGNMLKKKKGIQLPHIYDAACINVIFCRFKYFHNLICLCEKGRRNAVMTFHRPSVLGVLFLISS